MNKILSVLLFPFIWLFTYLYRIIWFDLVRTIIEIIGYIFISPFAALWLIITLPIVMIIEIPVGLVMTFLTAIAACADIWSYDADIIEVIKYGCKANCRG